MPIHTYWLLHALRAAAPRKSPWRRATFQTIRNVFVKIATRVEELKSRVTIAWPTPAIPTSACWR